MLFKNDQVLTYLVKCIIPLGNWILWTFLKIRINRLADQRYMIIKHLRVSLSLSIIWTDSLSYTHTAFSGLIECRGQTLRRHSSSLKPSSVRHFINECNRGHMAAFESFYHMSGKKFHWLLISHGMEIRIYQPMSAKSTIYHFPCIL